MEEATLRLRSELATAVSCKVYPRKKEILVNMTEVEKKMNELEAARASIDRHTTNYYHGVLSKLNAAAKVRQMHLKRQMDSLMVG